MSASIICSDSSISYVTAREKDKKHIKNIIKNNPNVKIEYAKTDNWIRINNEIINAITREDIQKIYKSLDIDMPEEGGQ